jgi:hypothetical protein
VPLNKELRAALIELKALLPTAEAADHIIHSERDIGMSAGAVQVWFLCDPRVCWSLIPQRWEDVRNEVCQEHHCRWWLPPTRSGACRSRLTEHNPTVHSG